MSATGTNLRLLGLAEELGDAEPPVGDPRLQGALAHLLDRVVDALVDVAHERTELSRRLPPAPRQPHDPGGVPADRAACSALAASCHRAVAALGDPVPDTLGATVADALGTLAAGLQRFAQDLADADTVAARQRLHRVVRRATAVLDAAGP